MSEKIKKEEEEEQAENVERREEKNPAYIRIQMTILIQIICMTSELFVYFHRVFQLYDCH